MVFSFTGWTNMSAAFVLLAPGESLPVTIDINNLGPLAGVYALRAGNNSVPLTNSESSQWLRLFFPAAVVTVT